MKVNKCMFFFKFDDTTKNINYFVIIKNYN